jgi:hypothetical protein
MEFDLMDILYWLGTATALLKSGIMVPLLVLLWSSSVWFLGNFTEPYTELNYELNLICASNITTIVDCDQKDVYSVEDGNHELVTEIETVSADRSNLFPSIIYQGKCQDL